jgi:translocator protein
MIPSWLIIGAVATLIAIGVLKLNTPEGIRWFNRQRRPRWLTFERLIPVIWITVFICGAWSAYMTWEAEPQSLRTWCLMILYAIVEILIMLYNPVMAWFKSLTMGVWIGAIGFVFGAILAVLVFPTSFWGAILLLPYLLWSPVGTYVTWVMSEINHPNHDRP